jgi:hypothetical protein
MMLWFYFSLRGRTVRRVSQFKTGERTVSGFRAEQRTILSSKKRGAKVVHGQIELDSHADTIVCGANCTIMSYTGKECDVSPYTDAYERMKSVPIVRAGTAYDSPTTGETFILIFNEAIWMGDKMDHTLVNPNQLRSFGITVQDNPFAEAPTYLSTKDNDFVMPLSSSGTIIKAPTRTPTDRELHECRHIELSSNRDWDPQNVRFPKASRTVEEEITRTIGIGAVNTDGDRWDGGSDELPCYAELPVFDMGGMSQRLIASVKVQSVPRQVSQVEVQDVPQLKTFQSKGRHSSVTPEDLSEKWGISLVQAKETLKRTTQRLLRSAALPLARRYHADRMFEKKRLRGMWSSDTMDS